MYSCNRVSVPARNIHIGIYVRGHTYLIGHTWTHTTAHMPQTILDSGNAWYILGTRYEVNDAPAYPHRALPGTVDGINTGITGHRVG